MIYFTTVPIPISSIYSESTGLYYKQIEIQIPVKILRPAWNWTYLNVVAGVKTSGIYFVNYVTHNKSNNSLYFIISSLKEFTNVTIELSVQILITFP